MRIAKNYIHHHLGLGDHIVCNGLVRRLIDRMSGRVTMACKPHNVPSVKMLYQGSGLQIDPCVDDKSAESAYKNFDTVYRVGFEKCHLPKWEESFYDQFHMDYEERFSNFSIKRSPYRESNLLGQLHIAEPYAIASTQTSAGKNKITLDTNLRVIEICPMTDSLFDWILVIEKSTEVHMVDSAPFQLVKQIGYKKRKVFYDTRPVDGTRTDYTFEDNSWEKITI